MTKLRVHSFSISLDGFGTGPHQTLDNPLGIGGTALREWVFATRTFRQMFGSDGGTTFHFVTDGIHAALQRAADAAKGQDVRLGSDVATLQQYLRAGLADETHLAISPVVLGSGEHLLLGIDLPKLGYQCTEHIPTQNATHVVLTKRR